MTDTAPIAEMTITEVLERWPDTAAVFHEFNMACVGCAVAPYYSVADAAHVYDIPVADFVARLEATVALTGSEADHSAQ